MMREILRIAMTVEETAKSTGLSRRTVDTAIRVGLITAIKTGASGAKQLLLVDDVVSLLQNARDLGLVLNDDLAHMAVVKEAIATTKKWRR